MSHQGKTLGFTLIEVLLAMTLLSIMVVLLFGSLRISAESWNAGESKLNRINEKAVVYGFFKRHLTSVRPLWDDFSTDEHRFSFQGERDKLQFVSVFPASAGRKGLQLFEIAPDRRNKHTLTVTLTPFFPTEDHQEWNPEQVTLLEHVAKFKIAYFRNESDSGSWVDEWQNKDALPALIKIHIALEDESYWPDMIFPLKLSGTQSFTGINEGLQGE